MNHTRKSEIVPASHAVIDNAPPERSLPRANRRGLQRSSEILACAIELFLERGYDTVSINDVVAKVGGSKTNVYSYYGDKTGLFRAAMATLTEEILAPLHELEVKDLPLEKGLQQIARKILAILLRKRHLEYQRLIFAEAPRHPEIGRMWFEKGPHVTRSFVSSFLRKHQAEGTISLNVDVEQAAVMFHDIVVWNPLLRTMFGQREEPAASVTAHSSVAVKLFVAALTK